MCAVKRHAGHGYLLCRPPSGNSLCYCDPRCHEETDAISYSGIDATATGDTFGKWQRLTTYGGKLVENACYSKPTLGILSRAIRGNANQN